MKVYYPSRIEENKSFETNDTNTSSINEEEYTPKLFSDEDQSQSENDLGDTREDHSEKLLDQEINEEEDFEIPAFLRKQKF